MQATAHRQPFCCAPGGDKSNYGGYIMGSLRNIQLWAAVYPGYGVSLITFYFITYFLIKNYFQSSHLHWLGMGIY